MEEPAAMASSNSYFVMQNMDRACRICLQETTNLSPIFSKTQNEGNLANLQEKIQVCGAVECHEQDGLPALICEVCAYKATIAHEFRQLCQHSDIRLRIYYNKPTKFNATDSGTQTDLQMQTHFTTAKSLYNQYYVKQEVTSSQHFQDVITNGGFNTATQTNSVATEMESTMPAVHVSIPDKEGELFNCHLDFEDQPKVEDKSSEIVTCDNQNVPCAQELIPVSTNLIHDVCTIETNVDHSEDVKDVSYFTYVTKETTQEENSNMEKRMLTRKTKSVQSNVPIEITEIYYGVNNDNPEHSETNKHPEEMKFQCEVCSKFYNSEESFREHQLTHEETNNQSEICSKILSSPETLDKNKKIHVVMPHTCQICHDTFSNSQNLDKHMKSHNNEVNDTSKQVSSDDEIGEFEPIDNAVSGGESEGDNSNENETVELGNAQKVFNCEECGQCCSTLKNLRRHALIHGEKKYACTVCKKWFYRPDTLKKHAEKHGHGLLDNLSDDNKLYDSDDDAFPPDKNSCTGENVNPKKTDSEGESKGQYKCQSCDKVIATKKGLRRHVAMHKPKPEPSVCEICKKVCASQARLILHQKTHSKPKEKVPREYLCHICSKVYPSNSSLTYHMRTHTGIKPHVCKTCNSGFTTTTSLANHIRIHTGDKPFVCHVCSAAFAVSSAFRRHLTRHTGEANYLCKTCGKAFKRLSTLKEHTYTHSGEKPYVCKTCGAAYSHSGSLFAHQKRCRAQFNEIVIEDHHHTVAHHIHVNNVNNVQSSVRPLTEMSPF